MTKHLSFHLNLLAILLLAQPAYSLTVPQKKEQPVAKVLEQEVFIKQIEPPLDERRKAQRKYKSPEYQKWLLDYRVDNLVSVILNPLLKQYAAAHGISAAPDEIEGCIRVVFADYPNKDKPTERKIIRALAEQEVIQWKVSGALYKQYGGPVIFQQANPFEPIGAYQKFLEEHEQHKAFVIFNPQLRQAFWKYFTADHDAIPPEQINYDLPWWLQKPK